MNTKPKFKLFICYSHLDEEYINEFMKHISILKDNGLIEEWYDRKIVPGKVFQEEINENFDASEIFCLFISANFLSSDPCKKEKIRALELKKKKGAVVVPIILSQCGWKDDADISKLLALPTDGKTITSFPVHDDAWYIVYSGLKTIIEDEIKIKQLVLTKTFLDFLNNTELLAKAHSRKEQILIDDIFVYPNLHKYNDLGEFVTRVNSDKLIENYLFDQQRILISGEDQSGKTTLCKKFYTELRTKNYVPIYISDPKRQFHGKIENRISNLFKEQYEGLLISEIDKKKIVPIIDDFHYAQNNEKLIQDLSKYPYQIIIVDDIFRLNFRDESLLKTFCQFRILEFSPLFRNKLIKNWVSISDKENNIQHDQNEYYQNLDDTTELINNALGKIIGNGIMPAYPFFILSIICTYETFEKPLDQEITSQGYCYQALIYLYLRKQDVRNDEIDTYINFLTEFAFFTFDVKKNCLTSHELQKFMDQYVLKYNLPIKKEKLLNDLIVTHIISKDSLNNYTFGHLYLYYYFVAKYLSDHINEKMVIIKNILNNLHKNENAYIAIFISHHSKNPLILEEMVKNAKGLFSGFEPTSLSKDDLLFFDEQLDKVVKEVLPPFHQTPEKQREKNLEAQEIAESIKSAAEDKNKFEEDELVIELRRSVKTVEVMGQIIKNRSGSLKRELLESVFDEAMNVHLRLLSSFFNIIKEKEAQKEIVDYIITRLQKVIEKKERMPSIDKLEKLATTMFWNLNFFMILGLINKIIHSLGSNKLLEIVEKVCDNNNTPASYIIKHGIYMWYAKNLQIDDIIDLIEDKNYSELSKKALKFMIVKHCSMHSISYKDKQKIEEKLHIPQYKLLC